MSHTLSRALRLVALLALFLAGTAGHEVAMAGETVAQHGTMHHNMRMADHHKASVTCADAPCDLDTKPCCVMGQCLLGIMLFGEVQFPHHTAVRLVPEPLLILATLVTDDHFRPPTVV
jgi:hypothetical protein